MINVTHIWWRTIRKFAFGWVKVENEKERTWGNFQGNGSILELNRHLSYIGTYISQNSANVHLRFVHFIIHKFYHERKINCTVDNVIKAKVFDRKYTDVCNLLWSEPDRRCLSGLGKGGIDGSTHAIVPIIKH